MPERLPARADDAEATPGLPSSYGARFDRAAYGLDDYTDARPEARARMRALYASGERRDFAPDLRRHFATLDRIERRP